jgi:RHS repeat-associated protein
LGGRNPISKLNSRTYYSWNGDAVIAEYAETAVSPWSPQWTKSFVYLGGRMLATMSVESAGRVVRYNYPERHGARFTTSPADDDVVEQVTLPFGVPLDTNSSSADRRRFASYDRSPTTQLDYAANRYYDPITGRFTQPDPRDVADLLTDPQSINPYSYARNDPINNSDPLGLRWVSYVDEGCVQKNTEEWGLYICSREAWVDDPVSAPPDAGSNDGGGTSDAPAQNRLPPQHDWPSIVSATLEEQLEAEAGMQKWTEMWEEIREEHPEVSRFDLPAIYLLYTGKQVNGPWKFLNQFDGFFGAQANPYSKQSEALRYERAQPVQTGRPPRR